MANDRTAEYVIKLIGKDEDLRRKVEAAIADMQKLGKQAGITAKANSAIMSSLKGLAAAAGAAFTAKAIIDYTKEAVNLAAVGEGVREAFAKLDQPNLLDNLRKATRGTVSDLNLMKTAKNTLLQFAHDSQFLVVNKIRQAQKVGVHIVGHESVDLSW